MFIAIHGHSFKEDAHSYIQLMFDELAKNKIEYQIYQPYDLFLKKSGIKRNPKATYTVKEEIEEVDMIFSIGGDGTLLETASWVSRRGIPILGINAGRLGFLATTQRDEVSSAIESIKKGFYEFDNRVMLRLESDKGLFGDTNFALNEFTILKRDSSSMIVVHTFIDGEYLNSYWSDGLIVATPTGSTGYSLSVGGPLVLPQSQNFIIAPVSPHNLNVRPMVVSDRSVISFEIEGRSKKFLVSLDSRSMIVDASAQMAVRKEDFPAKLVKLVGFNFLMNLRQKLNWGTDVRN